MISAFTPSDIVINPSTVMQDITAPLIVKGNGMINTFVGFSATSLCSVVLDFNSSYTEWGGCKLEKLTNQENIENLYALHFSFPKYRYLPKEPSSRSIEFNVSASTCNIIGKQSTFSIVQNGCEIELPCITFTSVAGNSKVGLASIGSGQTEIKYSTDGRSWENFETGVTITISEGDEMYVKGVMNGDNTSTEHTQFTVTGNVSVRGKLKNLWNYNDLEQPLYEFCGFELFRGCTGLTDASGLILNESDDLLSANCYNGMFYGCTALTAAPELPAIDTAERCYRRMFYGCTRLGTAPTLPATGIASYCYSSMFYECTNLLNVQESLPAAELATWCYSYMFRACTRLVKAPLLPATTLADGCYYSMFYGCTNLLNVQESLPAEELATWCYGYMFKNCTRLVKAPLLPATTLAEYCYYAMFDTCSALTEVPEILPATNLPHGVFTGPMEFQAEWGDVIGCYTRMFSSCANLVNTPILPAKRLTESCYAFMFSNSPKVGNVTILAEDLTISTLETTFANNASPTIDMFHYGGGGGIIATINLTGTAMAQFNNESIIPSYYTHKPPAAKRHTLTQEEINEIVEHYHIHYDD